MSIKEEALDAMVTYFDAHEACNTADTPRAQIAKRQAHSKLIQVLALYRPQHKALPKPER